MTEIETTIWKFVREDLAPATFEQWVYAHPELEEFFGEEFYLGLISSGFVQERHLYELRESLRDWMEANTAPICDCVTWRTHQVLAAIIVGFMSGQQYLSEKFETLKRQDGERSLIACCACKQHWYLGIDEVYVDHHLLRLSDGQVDNILQNNEWPENFDTLNVYPDDYFAPMNTQPKSYKSTLQRLRVPLGFITAILFIVFSQPSWQTIAIGGPIALLGVAIRAWASGHLRKNAELAISGPYAYTRNPLYFGSFILALGVVICGGSWWLALLLLGFFLAVYVPVMQAEAAHMHELFPRDFPAYEQHVPLFLPRLTAWKKAATRFDQSLYIKYREYRALIGLLVVVGILVLRIVLQS